MAGCGEPPPQPLRVGTNVWPGYEPLYLARGLGYLAPNVRLVEFGSTTEVLRSFRAGTLELAAATVDEALTLIADREPLAIVLVLDLSAGADAVIGQPAITSVGQLVGKRVGVETAATGGYLLARMLEQHQIDPRNITIVPLVASEVDAAYRDRKVDAVVTFEPTRTRLLNRGANLLFDSRQITGEIGDLLIARRDVVRQRPEEIRALVTAWFRAADFLAANPGKAAALMAPRLGLSETEIARALSLIELPSVEANRRWLVGANPEILVAARRVATHMVGAALLPSMPLLDTGLLHFPWNGAAR